MKTTRPILALPLLLIVATAVFASGCVSYRVQVDYDREADFAALRTYRWMELPAANDPRLDNDLIRKRFRAAIDRVLGEKGLSLVESGEVDLLVVYHAAIERRLDIDARTGYYGYRRHPSVYADTYVREYDVGSLIIDLLRADNRRLIWRGTGQAQVNEWASAAQRDRRAQAAVTAILEDFPPSD